MFNNKEFVNFESASEAVLKFLYDRYGFDLWMVTRVRDDRWILLRTMGDARGLSDGADLVWSETICWARIRDAGPCIASGSADVPAYVEASIGQHFDIRSYVGMPIQTSCGKFRGTLSAVGSDAHPEFGECELPLLEVLAGMLAGYARKEIESHEFERRSERFRFEGMTDSLTHLPNRRAWEEKLEKEQLRSVRIGDTTFISIIDVKDLEEIHARDGHAAGDEMLLKTAVVLRYSVRNADFVARLGNDEFAVLGMQCDTIDTGDVSTRLRRSLARAGIRAAVGTSLGQPSASQTEIWRYAVDAMRSDRKSNRRFA